MNKNLINYLLISELSKDYLPRMPIGDIFHYTSSNTLKNILFEHKQVVLHASRYELLNDTMEGIYILEVYKEACEELFEDRKISKNFSLLLLIMYLLYKSYDLFTIFPSLSHPRTLNFHLFHPHATIYANHST